LTKKKFNKAESRIKFKRDILVALLILTVILNLFLPITSSGRLGLSFISIWLLLIFQVKGLLAALSYGEFSIPMASILFFRIYQGIRISNVHGLTTWSFVILIFIDFCIICYSLYFRSTMFYKLEKVKIKAGGKLYVEQDR
jgi:hypothetical protein